MGILDKLMFADKACVCYASFAVHDAFVQLRA